jgi:hypothetical protein
MMAQDPPPFVGEMKKNNQLAIGACDEKGKGSKVMTMVIKVAGDEKGDGNEEGDDQRGWIAMKRVMALAARAMATRVAGKEQQQQGK